jgi:pimeloyl-ACP methyl ester carboxylesterase
VGTGGTPGGFRMKIVPNRFLVIALLPLALAGEALPQGSGGGGGGDPADSAMVLESIRLDALFPSLTAFPSYECLRWRSFKGNLESNRVSEAEQTVSSGVYYVAYVELQNTVKEQEKVTENAEVILAGIPERYDLMVRSARGKIRDAQDRLENSGNLKAKRREQLEQVIVEQQAALEIFGQSRAEELQAAGETLAYHQEKLARLKALPAKERSELSLVNSAAVTVIGGITYMADPDEWLATVEQHDPLFRDARSAGVGEISLRSPKVSEHSYNVRFKRGSYVASLLVSWGTSTDFSEKAEEEGISIATVGKRIALAFDQALQGGVPGISVEKNPSTDRPYEGLVADGETTLEISVLLPGAADLKVVVPTLGTLFHRVSEVETPLPDGRVPLTHDGRARLFYRPPDYLQDADLTETIEVSDDSLDLGTPVVVERIWHGKVPLVFTYVDSDGHEQQTELLLRACRPPLCFVHGFTGGLATWENLDGDMRSRKWHTKRETYYHGQQDIVDQATLLRTHIQELRARYDQLGVKAKKVDIVAHSMGGLISRHYISISGTFDDDVHKLIMVATPNHGSTWTDKQFGVLASAGEGFKHWRANADLYSGSDFMKRMNEGESYGKHVNPGVQYAVAYGRRHAYHVVSKHGIPTEFMVENDGVVTVESAILNGVTSRRFDSATHSDALREFYFLDTSVTEDRTIWKQVREWLLADIPPARFYKPRALVTQVQGEAVRSAGFRRLLPIRKGGDVKGFLLTTGNDGSFSVALMADSETWGTVKAHPDSELLFQSISKNRARLHVYRGIVEFSFVGGTENSCVVAVGDRPKTTMEFDPLLRVYHLDTEFTVARDGDSVEVVSREGRLLVEHVDTDGQTAHLPILSGERATMDLGPARDPQGFGGRSDPGEAPDSKPVVPVPETPVTPETGPPPPAKPDPADPAEADPPGGAPTVPTGKIGGGTVTLGETTFLKDAVLVSVDFLDVPVGTVLSVEVGGDEGAPPRVAMVVVGGSGRRSCRISAPLMGWSKAVQPIRIRLKGEVVLESTTGTKKEE